MRNGTRKMRGNIDSKNALWLAPTGGFDQNESSSLCQSSEETEFTHLLLSSELRILRHK